jgi:hypothetical protein
MVCDDQALTTNWKLYVNLKLCDGLSTFSVQFLLQAATAARIRARCVDLRELS